MKYKSAILNLFICLLIIVNGTVFAENIARLPGYEVDLSKTSFSGLSSGAFMTAQFHVAYSDRLVGVGIVAGGPYYCSGSNDASSFMERMRNATHTCMDPFIDSQAPNAEKLFEKATQFAKEKKIADLNNLKDDKVYLFSGSNDTVVRTIVVDQVEKFYKAAGVSEENIKYNKSVHAGHAIITDDSGNECSEAKKSPFISDCDFEQSHRILKHIYGKLNPAADSNALSGKIVKFDQSEFIESERSSMSKEAYAYVPKSCETEKCIVHVAIHGCLQGSTVIGDDYYTLTGYNEIADTNKIIVLYPQVEVSKTVPLNPLGCWDFWGYSSPDPNKEPNFHTREAPQMKAIAGMLKRLAEPRSR